MISYGYYEYNNMYHKSIMLFLDGLVQFVEDDLFPLTISFDLDVNQVVLVQLTWLLVELLVADAIKLIMNKGDLQSFMLVLDKMIQAMKYIIN